jgi:hypothetical protein
MACDMNSKQSRIPVLDKAERPLPTLEAHARALEIACRAAAQIMASRPAGTADAQAPLPRSSIELLRRLPRSDP